MSVDSPQPLSLSIWGKYWTVLELYASRIEQNGVEIQKQYEPKKRFESNGLAMYEVKVVRDDPTRTSSHANELVQCPDSEVGLIPDKEQLQIAMANCRPRRD